jgi:predicted RNA-binding protein
MAYFIDLFSPDTHDAFSKSDRSISGFRERQKSIAVHIKPGDKFICYVTKLSRWIGVLKVKSTYFIDDNPIFTQVNDPFVIRFEVEPSVWLPLDESIPVSEDLSWNHLQKS